MSIFQFKLEDHSATFDEKDVWADDCLGIGDDTSRHLHGIVSGQERPLTICLNGEWGSGKTFFLTRFAENYNKRKPEGRAVYFNAWQDDFLDDPLLAIISQLQRVVKNESESKLYASIKNAAAPCLAKIGLSLVKQMAKKVTGIDVDSIELDDLKAQTETLFEQYHEMDASRKLLRETMAKLAEETWRTTAKPLLFIIDELDRCRPTFAIELLERIKHLFNVPHLVFIVGVDLCQLEKSVKAVYGDIDANDYLHRFFDVEFRLPSSNKLQYVYWLWQEHHIESTFQHRGVDVDSQRSLLHEFDQLIQFRNLTLRQIEKSVRTYALLAMSRDNAACKWAFLAAIAVVLKVTDVESYERFINMEYTLGELVNSLYPGATFKDISSESGIYNMVLHLSKIAYYRSEKSKGHLKLERVKKAMVDNKEITFDPDIMPKCFEECSPEQIASFYPYVFDDNLRFVHAFRGVPAILQQMNNGLQFIS